MTCVSQDQPRTAASEQRMVNAWAEYNFPQNTYISGVYMIWKGYYLAKEYTCKVKIIAFSVPLMYLIIVYRIPSIYVKSNYTGARKQLHFHVLLHDFTGYMHTKTSDIVTERFMFAYNITNQLSLFIMNFFFKTPKNYDPWLFVALWINLITWYTITNWQIWFNKNIRGK